MDSGPKLAQDAYVEMMTPGGSIDHGIRFDMQLDDGLVTLITVVPADGVGRSASRLPAAADTTVPGGLWAGFSPAYQFK